MSVPSPHVDGKLSLDQLRSQMQSGLINTVLAVFPDLYGRFVGKRFDAQYFVDTVAGAGTHACDYLLTVDMEMEPVAGYALANWEKGYGDFHLQPDFNSLRVADWLDATAMVICDVEDPGTHQAVSAAPRGMLRRQIEAAGQLGFDAMAGSEVEYYIFRDSYRDAATKKYTDLEPAGWYIEDYHTLQGSRCEQLNGAVRQHLSRSGVPVECTKGEWGLGQHELNIRYCDVLEMADRHSVYKQCMRETADKLGWSVSFMAKFAPDRAGSSCHIHLSLWRDDTNAFSGSGRLGSVNCSDEFRWFLGGWIRRARELMAFYAPNVNSYKRYQPGSWAPTRLAWSVDNRTAGFRVVGEKSSLRIECRIPGADCNPYLAYAAALASGLDGIANRVEPPAAFAGNAYEAAEHDALPRNLDEATQLLSDSQFARQAFGDDVVDHYAHFFRTEVLSFERSVTDWERARYFERI